MTKLDSVRISLDALRLQLNVYTMLLELRREVGKRRSVVFPGESTPARDLERDLRVAGGEQAVEVAKTEAEIEELGQIEAKLDDLTTRSAPNGSLGAA